MDGPSIWICILQTGNVGQLYFNMPDIYVHYLILFYLPGQKRKRVDASHRCIYTLWTKYT